MRIAFCRKLRTGISFTWLSTRRYERIIEELVAVAGREFDAMLDERIERAQGQGS